MLGWVSKIRDFNALKLIQFSFFYTCILKVTLVFHERGGCF